MEYFSKAKLIYNRLGTAQKLTVFALLSILIYSLTKKMQNLQKSFLGRTDLPRGIRNNNPGNLVITPLKWKGKIPREQNTDGKFEQFTEFRYGVRAMLKDILNDIAKPGQNTIRGLITTYAPKFENNTEAYIANVAKAVGISPTAKLSSDKETLRKLAKAIHRVENGIALSDTDFENGYKLI